MGELLVTMDDPLNGAFHHYLLCMHCLDTFNFIVNQAGRCRYPGYVHVFDMRVCGHEKSIRVDCLPGGIVRGKYDSEVQYHSPTLHFSRSINRKLSYLILPDEILNVKIWGSSVSWSLVGTA